MHCVWVIRGWPTSPCSWIHRDCHNITPCARTQHVHKRVCTSPYGISYTAHKHAPPQVVPLPLGIYPATTTAYRTAFQSSAKLTTHARTCHASAHEHSKALDRLSAIQCQPLCMRVERMPERPVDSCDSRSTRRSSGGLHAKRAPHCRNIRRKASVGNGSRARVFTFVVVVVAVVVLVVYYSVAKGDCCVSGPCIRIVDILCVCECLFLFEIERTYV